MDKSIVTLLVLIFACTAAVIEARRRDGGELTQQQHSEHAAQGGKVARAKFHKSNCQMEYGKCSTTETAKCGDVGQKSFIQAGADCPPVESKPKTCQIPCPTDCKYTFQKQPAGSLVCDPETRTKTIVMILAPTNTGTDCPTEKVIVRKCGKNGGRGAREARAGKRNGGGGRRRENMEHEAAEDIPMLPGRGARKGEKCKYKKELGECDPTTNMMTVTMTLKENGPANCPQVKTKTKSCKVKRAKNGKQRNGRKNAETN